MFDCIVKGGTLVNGLGMKPETGDLAIKDGVIAEVGGKITGHAARTIDADGAVVTQAGLICTLTTMDKLVGTLRWPHLLTME